MREHSSIDYSNWSIKELQSTHDSLGSAIHHPSKVEKYCVVAAIALIVIGLGALILVMERARYWEICCILFGVAGAIWAHRQDKKLIGQQKIFMEIKEEMNRRKVAVEQTRKFTENDFLRIEASIKNISKEVSEKARK